MYLGVVGPPGTPSPPSSLCHPRCAGIPRGRTPFLQSAPQSLNNEDTWASSGPGGEYPRSGAAMPQEWRKQVESQALWRELDLRERRDALQTVREAARVRLYREHLVAVNLQFVMGVEDADVAFLAGCRLTHINLNGCQK